MNLIYIMDPMCGWCWGFASVLDKLQEKYPDTKITPIPGGLAPDTDQPMPEDMQKTIQGYWHKIEAATGARFNHDFWAKCQPRRSTYPACRAVLVAGQLRQHGDWMMMKAIQQGYYLQARNPSNIDTLIAMAGETGLDQTVFQQQLINPETDQQLQTHLQTVAQLGIQGFPALLAESDTGTEQLTALALGYCDWPTLEGRLQTIS